MRRNGEKTEKNVKKRQKMRIFEKPFYRHNCLYYNELQPFFSTVLIFATPKQCVTTQPFLTPKSPKNLPISPNFPTFSRPARRPPTELYSPVCSPKSREFEDSQPLQMLICAIFRTSKQYPFSYESNFLRTAISVIGSK